MIIGVLQYHSKDKKVDPIMVRNFATMQQLVHLYKYYMIETNVNGPTPRTKGRTDPKIIFSKMTLNYLAEVSKK